MKITLSPSKGLPGAAETTLSIAGDVLTYDGVAYDLSPVPEGGEATPDGLVHPFTGPITRVGGEIACAVMVTLGDTASPIQSSDPADWVLGVADGAVDLPIARIPEPEPEPELELEVEPTPQVEAPE